MREGKRFMTVAIGCTGGKHRRVAMAEEVAAAAARRAASTPTPCTATWGGSERGRPDEISATGAPGSWSRFGGGHGLHRCRCCRLLVAELTVAT